MFKPLLTGGYVLILLLTTSATVRAETPQSESSSLPIDLPAQPLLHEYAATDAVPILQLGSTGSAVVDVQQFLAQAGLYDGAIDGRFGTESQAAVAQFQWQNNLSVDGVVGHQTWSAMIYS